MQFVLFFIALLINAAGLPSISPRKAVESAQTTTVTHSARIFDSKFYAEGYALSDSYMKKPEGKVMGGILPHHLYAAPLIAGFFRGIAKQEIKRVILLSPNHYNAGPYAITTSEATWETPYGNIGSDLGSIRSIQPAINVSEDLFDNEHGIYGIVPFVKKTFPTAIVIPLVFKGNTTKDQADELVKKLGNIVDDQTLVIGSVDFSHYLPSDQADIRDAESIPALLQFQTDKLLTMDSTKNFDSPAALYVLEKLMQQSGATKPMLINNTNSAKLADDLSIQSTTSYVTMYFIK